MLLTNHQPDHVLEDAEAARRKLGKERADKESYLFKSLLDANALVPMGSDSPVSMWHLLTTHVYAHVHVSHSAGFLFFLFG